MIDNEIIKALECCRKRTVFEKCPIDCPMYKFDGDCFDLMQTDIIDFINRQQAEIESNKAKIKISAECIARQDKEIERLKGDLHDCVREVSRSHEIDKNKAIKEFAKKIRQKISAMVCSPDLLTLDDYDKCIDDVLKEMVGEKNEIQKETCCN